MRCEQTLLGLFWSGGDIWKQFLSICKEFGWYMKGLGVVEFHGRMPLVPDSGEACVVVVTS
jgi:hypothetical protein